MNTRSVVILAAGIGSRLHPLTDTIPKALVPVAGTPILAYTLDAVAERARAGQCDVTVVVGYRGDQIASYARERFPFVRTIWNHHYRETNNMFSLFLALATVPPANHLTFMNGDCLYERPVIDAAVTSPGTCVFCDPGREYSDESMKIVGDERRALGISKAITRADAYAVTCDLYSIDASATHALAGIVHQHIARADLNSWTEVALDTAMRTRAIDFTPKAVNGFWYEIDDHLDLAAAAETVHRTTRANAATQTV